MKQIDTAQRGWLHQTVCLLDNSNIICIAQKRKPLQWFGAQLTQFLVQMNSSEICALLGNNLRDVNDLAYQLCESIPCEYEIGKRGRAVQDFILNFTTQPERRYFIWHDAQQLFRSNRPLFDVVLAHLENAALPHTNGVAAPAPSQRIIFLFDTTAEEEVRGLGEVVSVI